MSAKTKQLSGHAKDRFLEQLIADESGLPADAALRLTARARAVISGVRVRRDEGIDLRPARGKKSAGGEKPEASGAVAPDRTSAAAAPAVAAPKTTQPFDPYVFGLVPVYQREGRDGLATKLMTVGDVGQLRLMAQKQQIALPASIRAGDVAADEVRAAIIAAVEKRVADRKAAAS